MKTIERDESSSSSDTENEENRNDKLLTAAELMRRRLGSDNDVISKTEKKEETVGDIDDEIKRLEAELADDYSDSDSDDDESDEKNSSSESEEENAKRKRKKITFGDTTILSQQEKEDGKNLDSNSQCGVTPIFCASKCADDAITPLPTSALPKCKSKKLKIDYDDQGSNNSNSESTQNKRKKRKRSSSDKDGKDKSQSSNNTQSDGLRQAVLEVLQGYIPRSSERIPFYCRVCSHKSSNEEDFLAHKKTEFHKTAVQVEKKKTYCKLCRKQLTSLVQMQEHLQSKPHKEKLDFVQARQRGESVNNQDRRHQPGGRGGKGRDGRGAGRGGRDDRGSSGRGVNRMGQFQDGRANKRQWC